MAINKNEGKYDGSKIAKSHATGAWLENNGNQGD